MPNSEETILTFYAEVSLIQDYVLNDDGTLGDKIPVYHTEITVFDQTKSIWAGKDVKICATEKVTVTIAGQQHELDYDQDIIVKTNGLGKIRVELVADTLDAPELLLHASFMDDKQRVKVNPSAQAQEELTKDNDFAGLMDRLSKAKDYDGNPIVKPEFLKDPKLMNAAAGTMYATISMSTNSQTQYYRAGNHTDDHCCEDCDPLVCCCCQTGDEKCEVIFDSNYGLSFSDNSYKKTAGFWPAMPDDELQAWIDSYPTTYAIENVDFWKALKKVGNKVVDAVVYVAKKTVEVIATIIVDGAEMVGKAIVKTVDQAMILVGNIVSNVAHSVGKVLEWVSHVFDWDKIVEVHNSIGNAITQGVQQIKTSDALDKAQQNIDDCINDIKGNVDAKFDQLAGWAGTKNAADNQKEGYVDGMKKKNSSSGGVTENWLFAKLESFAANQSGSAQIIYPTFDPGLLTADFDQFFQNAKTQCTDQIMDDIRNMDLVKNPPTSTNLMETATNAIITGLKTIADIILDIVSAILDGTVGLCKKVLQSNELGAFYNGAVEIPFVTALYCAVTGLNTMTMKGLLALLAAVPGVAFNAILGTTTALIKSPNADSSQKTDPMTLFAIANVLQFVGGLLVAADVCLNTFFKWLRSAVFVAARIVYFIGILGSKTGKTLEVAIILWFIPTINLFKDMYGLYKGWEWEDNELSSGFTTIFGLLMIAMLLRTFEPETDFSAASRWFVLCVALSFILAPVRFANPKPGVVWVMPLRGTLVAVSGIIGYVNNGGF